LASNYNLPISASHLDGITDLSHHVLPNVLKIIEMAKSEQFPNILSIFPKTEIS
jgi:hypothetical protein